MPASTILIADDEPHIRMVLARKFAGLGHRVVEAADGEEAFDLARAERPDAIVSDLQMPGMSGLELCTRLKAEDSTRGIPALLLTARGYLIDDASRASTNIVAVMAKPFSVRDVAERVGAMLQDQARARAA